MTLTIRDGVVLIKTPTEAIFSYTYSILAKEKLKTQRSFRWNFSCLKIARKHSTIMGSQSASATKALENALAMTGNEGEASYSVNSVMQMRFTKAMQPLLRSFVKKTCEKMMLNKDTNVRIADTGCATGSNTLVSVGSIVETVETFCIDKSVRIREFMVYFCDLPSNDFNTLLRTLPLHRRGSHSASSKGDAPLCGSYFAAAVSGSHHTRLFPSKSIQFFHSATSLHWLSRVPAQAKDRNSAAWNGEHVFIQDDEVGKVYLRQFGNDISCYLSARAEEMMQGGGLFVGMLGRPSKDPKQQGGLGAFILHMENVLKEMMEEGVVERRALEEFNMPQYAPCVEEMEEIFVENAKWFENIEVRLLTDFPLQTMESVKVGEEAEFGKSVEMLYRSIFQKMLSAHFGWEKCVLDDFFARLNAQGCENPYKFLRDKIDILVAYATRK